DRLLVLAPDLLRVSHGGQHAARLRLAAVRIGQVVMCLGALRILGHRLFEGGDRGVAVATAERGPPLLDQRRLGGRGDGCKYREDPEWKPQVSCQGGAHGRLLSTVQSVSRRGVWASTNDLQFITSVRPSDESE